MSAELLNSKTRPQNMKKNSVDRRLDRLEQAFHECNFDNDGPWPGLWMRFRALQQREKMRYPWIAQDKIRYHRLEKHPELKIDDSYNNTMDFGTTLTMFYAIALRDLSRASFDDYRSIDLEPWRQRDLRHCAPKITIDHLNRALDHVDRFGFLDHAHLKQPKEMKVFIIAAELGDQLVMREFYKASLEESGAGMESKK